MKIIIRTLLIIAFLAAILFYLTRLPGDKRVMQKKRLIETRLAQKGYKGGFIIISQKRHQWYNSLLTNSIDRSNHLKGLAMDLWVMDLDGNGKWERNDIDLMVETINEIDREHPELAGWINTYTDKGFMASRMVHFDIGGRRNPKYPE